MEKDPKITVILIPGANPTAAEQLFTALKKELKSKNYDTIELEKADEEKLISVAKELKVKMLIGKSLGGRVAINYQLNQQDAAALVLLAPAVRGNKKFAEINVPVLILHGTNDPVIPIKNSQNLVINFNNAELVEISNTDHGFSNKLGEVIATISDWLSSIND